LQTETTKRGLRRALAEARAHGQRIALVPTMGYLHEGHLRLVDHARKHGDVVVMSIFVNPLQFGPVEDLARYPRDLGRDGEQASRRGVDYLFVPGDQEMYERGGPAVTVVGNELANKLEGQFRPGHFEGVLTVVAKLCNIVTPDVAVFGQKDFQQCVMVKRMCRDLDMPVEIVVAPTVREPDGLAMSSRNVYLKPEERQSALQLSRALLVARERYAGGERDPNLLVDLAKAVLDSDGRVHTQYIALSDPETLDQPAPASDDSVMSVAALVGKTRLIDNMRMAE
jgi:pantoate--beta-alanine ligase